MIEKQYYTIPEIATLLGVNQSHVRLYIKEFDIFTYGKRYIVRRIHKDDVEKLKFIHHQVTVEGRHYWWIKELLNRKISD